jgi:ribonucleoside-triphosphate reductase
MVKVIKRDGRKIEFNEKKIFDAIHTAATNEGYILLDDAIDKIVEKVISVIKDSAINNSIDVETIQDIVVTQIGLAGFAELAIKYQQYREERTRNREGNTKIMKDIMKIGVQTDRDNANVGNNFSSKLLRIASEANK